MGKSVVIFLLISLKLMHCEMLSCSAQTSKNVTLLITVKDGKTKLPLDEVQIKVFQGVSFAMANATEKPGEFLKQLATNKEYLLGFYKSGYITKSVSLSTALAEKWLTSLKPDYRIEVLLLPGKTTDDDISNPSQRTEWTPPDVSRFTEKKFDMDKMTENDAFLQLLNLFLDNYYKEKNKKVTAEDPFEEKMKKKVEEENAKLRAEVERLKKEAEEKEKTEAESELLRAQQEEDRKMIEDFKRKQKESEERLKAYQTLSAAERERKEREEKAKVSAEMEQMAKQAEEKKQLERQLAQLRREKEEQQARLDAVLKAKADAEFESKGKGKTTTPATTVKLSPAEVKKKLEDERLKKEAADKSQKEREDKARIELEEQRRKEEEKAKTEAELKSNDESVRLAREAELRARENEAAVISNDDCDRDAFLDKCKKRLGDYSFVQSFKIENQYNEKPEGIKFNIVCTKDAHYMLSVCQGLGGRMIATVYDNDRKVVATSFNKKTKKHLSKIDFVAGKTGVYYFNFAFESEIGCGLSVMGVKK